MNRLEVWLPVTKILFSIIQDLTSLVGVLKCWTRVARDDRGIIEQVQQAATVASEHYLFLGTLDGGGEM